MARLWQKIVSFGAAGRVETVAAGYQEAVSQAQELAEQMEQERADAQLVLADLVTLKQACAADLAQVQRIAKNLSARERQFTVESVADELPSVKLKRIEDTLDSAALAMSAARGLATGASTAAGAWALAGAYGAASSGTALATLSGAAAQSATLAWFGGGSLATGGLGIAGGAAALGGIVAVPALAVLAIRAHSAANTDIARIEQERMELQRSVDVLRERQTWVALAKQRGNELIAVLTKEREVYRHRYTATYKRLYRWGWFSRAYRWLRGLLGLGPFSWSELSDIQDLLQVASEFATVIDQPVFEQEGAVRRTES